MKIRDILIILLLILPLYCFGNTVRRLVILPNHAGDIVFLSDGKPSVIKWEEAGRCIDYIQLPDRQKVVSISMEGDPATPEYYILLHSINQVEDKKRKKIKKPDNLTISDILDVSGDGKNIMVKVSLKKKTEKENLVKQMYGLIDIDNGEIKPLEL